jgi:uncharacterized membrane protein YbaN (DUF454 family)
MRVALWTIVVVTIGFMIFDLLTPVGVAVSVLYVTPLLLTFFCLRNRDPRYFSVVAAAPIWVALFVKPQLFQSLMACSIVRWDGQSCESSC